jgi:hypothetical protein
VTWKHIAAGGTLSALAIAFWVLTSNPRTETSLAPSEINDPITPDPETIAFGVDPAPRELTLRSTLGEDVEWSVRTGSRFEIVPEAGTIKPSGATTMRVRPRSASLTPGLNSEHTYFTLRTATGSARQLLVRLTAIRPPEVNYNLVEGDGEVVLQLNGTEVGRAKRPNQLQTVWGEHALRAGDNALDVRAAGSAKSSHYRLWLRVGTREMTVTEATPMPVIVTLDPGLGFISLPVSASPP